MRIPQDENGQQRAWTTEPSNDALLYFAQLIEEMVAYPTPEGLRAVSLDSYHRLTEVDRAWHEAENATVFFNLASAIEELIEYLDRDPVITEHLAEAWSAVKPRLISAKDRPKEAIEGVRYLADKLDPQYLRACRDYIENAVKAGKAKNKRDFRLVVENYCSFLSNMGYHDRSIHYRITKGFFDSEVEQNPVRAAQNFFALFPHNKKRPYTVAFAVSSDFANLLTKHRVGRSANPEFTNLLNNDGTLRAYMGRRPKDGGPESFWHLSNDRCFEVDVKALDEHDARAQCESGLVALRAVSYTAMPYARLEWDDAFIISKSEGGYTVLRDTMDAVRVGRRRVLHGLATNLESRFKFFLDDAHDEDDRNRLLNAITIYSSAFHSESVPSQLLSLWSTLEGLLPAPPRNGSRIASFSRDMESCYKRLYLVRQIKVLHHDLFSIYREGYTKILAHSTADKSDNVSRLAALLFLEEYDDLRTEICTLCGTNPLARQRLFEVYSAGKSLGGIHKVISSAARKACWQLYRIYRERNRIVHRASPSENVESLIRTLNAYVQIVFDALIGARAAGGQTRLDDLFAAIHINEEARERQFAALRGKPIARETIELALGPDRS